MKNDANTNPWYVLMTLYGGHDGKPFDESVDLRNRQVWNAWSCQGMEDSVAREYAKKARIDFEETRSWTAISKTVEADHKAAMISRTPPSFKYSGLPVYNERYNCSGLEVKKKLFMQSRIFSQDLDFDEASFSDGVNFASALLLGNVGFYKAYFRAKSIFQNMFCEGIAYFGHGGFVNGAEFSGSAFKGICSFDDWMFDSRDEIDHIFKFENVEFSGELNLTDTDFRKPVDFSGSKFLEIIGLRAQNFRGYAEFCNVDFRSDMDFNDEIFNNFIDFSGAKFEKGADFRNTEFKQVAQFSNVTFNESTDFSTMKLHGKIYFSGAKFLKSPHFLGRGFSEDVDFSKTEFLDDVSFEGVTFSRKVDFSRAVFAGFTYLQKAKFGDPANGNLLANFTDCQFEKPTSFREADFRSSYPIFTGAVLHENSDFSASPGFWPKLQQDNPKAARESCAKIRHAVDKQGLPEDAHFFFRREMEFARQVGPWWAGLPYRLFGLVSDYGHSIARPAWFLVALWALPALIYMIAFEWARLRQRVILESYEAVGFSFANIFKFFGFQRTYFDLAKIHELPGWIQVLSAAQTIFGFILLFFLGLGLRTRFRMR